MKKLGEQLRQHREEKNLSLKEVENATSIRMNYLKAIEDGDASKLISPVYAQGFVKQYACFLGLEGEQLIKEHQDSFGKLEKQEFSYGIGTLEKRGNANSSSGIMPTLTYVLLFAFALVAAWYFADFLGLL